ncbi:50S ribosomal protein L24 [miscellaneous Crenarchaeota group-15 archaeon DG-45]|uniref:Large ribosomal subunit protein uL24 n=1 Tax=miscellaneous Crenarchaeota group-15 archaeon DG-45 TaxID=1685127 RepID=A0A0M0BRW0_9ARCH|nr:MAG: 50S ribosomal protein L24 [miscellaneous Crenarchaeota group-15 archaeon DG-45]
MSKGGVTKPGKSRKRRFNAPHHVRRKFLSSPLSPSLRAQHGVRTMPVRRDDTVAVTKGDRRMTEGRVTRVNAARGRLFIEGVTRQRLDGSSVPIPVRPENVMIMRLSLDDERRRRILDRRGYESRRGRE